MRLEDATGSHVRTRIDAASQNARLVTPGISPALYDEVSAEVMDPKDGKKRLARASLAQGFITPSGVRRGVPPLRVPELSQAQARPPPPARA